jgi:tetratricopeptide (TPR) repeat protein
MYAPSDTGSSSNKGPSLDSVKFDDVGLKYMEEEPGRKRAWKTPDGDSLYLFFFPTALDLPANVSSVDELAAALHRLYAGAQVGGALVDLEVMSAGGCRIIRQIRSLPQQPRGLLYSATLFIPFREFSFTCFAQFFERGITGMREATLLERRMADGKRPLKVDFKAGQADFPDWDDPNAEKYDADFPDHPLSRARRVMNQITKSLAIEPDVLKLPSFPLPEPGVAIIKPGGLKVIDEPTKPDPTGGQESATNSKTAPGTDDAKRLIQLGIAHHAKGDFDQAVLALNRAVILDPKDATVYRLRDAVYLAKGDLDRALSDFDEAMRDNPKSAIVHYFRGKIYYAKGNFDLALTAFKEAIRLDPLLKAKIKAERDLARDFKRMRSETKRSERFRVLILYAPIFLLVTWVLLKVLQVMRSS